MGLQEQNISTTKVSPKAHQKQRQDCKVVVTTGSQNKVTISNPFEANVGLQDS